MKQLQIKTLFIFLAISLLLMVLDHKKVLEPVKKPVQRVMIPLQYFLYSTKLGVGNFLSFITFWKSGEQRIKNLELRNLELVAEKKRADILERENGELRKQLTPIKSGLVKNFVPATVVDVEQYLKIDTGQFEGKTVVYLDNLVGKIIKPYFVQLPIDSQFKIPVRVGKTLGLVSGQFNSLILLDRIAQNEEIKVDDLVVTAEDGWIVGKIKKIISTQTDLFQRAEVTPLVDYSRLTTIFIVLN